MLIFVFGLFVGCCLGVLLIALLVNSKEDDEAVWRVMEDKDVLAF